MKLAIVIILALACNMAFSEQVGKLCDSASSYWNGTGCSTCPTGCNECVSKGNAPSCINCGSNTGKYLNIVSDKGECANCSLNCLACRGPSPADCTQAAVGYKVSPTGIFKCSKPGCLYCSADDVCAKCEFGNRLDAGACTSCSVAFCAECPASISNCTKCNYRTQLVNGACTACEGCTSCPCTACVPGRRFDNGTCKACTDSNCLTCASDVGQCTACTSGFYVNGTACKQCATNCTACTAENKCTTCSSFGFFTLNDGVCTVCPDNCDKCDAKGACLTCKANYHLDGTKCTQCPSGCDGCDASGSCTKCQPGTIAKSDKKGCDPCPNFCSECSSTTVCTKCNPLLANPDGKNGCKLFASCRKGEQLDNNGTCSNGTLENCVYGNTAASACVQCSKAYYLNDKVCTPCPNGCEECVKDSNGYVTCATVAQPGFSIIKTNGKADNTAYVIGSNIATVDRNNGVKTCMPNNYFGKPIKNEANTQCVAPEKCTYPSGAASSWVCYLEGSNAAKVTVSLFAVIIAALFTL